MDSASSIDSYVIPPVVITDYKKFARKVCCFFLLVSIAVLTCIFILGASTTLIKSSTAVLQIDTTKATVHDIIGGIELLPIRSSTTSTTYTTRTTSTTNNIRSTSTTRFRTSTSTRSRTSTKTTSTSVETSIYLRAKSSLENLTELLSGIDSYVTTDDFSLARVFQIHDNLYLATGGFKCWSDRKSRDTMDVIGSSLDSCSSNGFLQCLSGKTDVESMYTSDAYKDINDYYLSRATSLNESDIDYISDLWSNVLSAANLSTVTLNFDPKGYKALRKLLCSDDYFKSVRNSFRRHASIPYILGLCSFSVTATALCFARFSIMVFMFWFISFVFGIVTFALLLNSNIPAVKYINQTDGIKAKANGLIAYFVVILVLNLVIILLFLIEFINHRKQKCEAKQDPLNDTPLETDPPNIPSSNDIITHKFEEELLSKR